MLSTSIFTDFSRIETEWEQLLSKAITNKVFLHPIYQKTWWETLGQGSLHIIAVHTDERELVGLAPVFIHDQQVGFVGCKDVTDYLDLIVHSDYQAEVYEILVKELLALFEQQQVRKIELCSLPATSPSITKLPDLIKTFNPSLSTSITQQDVCPRISLPSDFEDYLQTLERKQRHEIRRKLRKLESEAEVHFRCVTTPEEAVTAVPTFISLHQQSSQEKHDFWKDEHRTFFELLLPRLAEVGWIKLYFLEIHRWLNPDISLPLPTTPVAAMLVFDYDDTFNLYNSGFDPSYGSLSTGQVLTAYTIKQAIELKRTVYDFLRGSEKYKFRLGGQPLPVMDLVISPDTQ